MQEFDEDIWRRAHKAANERYPLPNDTPGIAGFRALIMAWAIIICFYLLLPIGWIWAALLTSVLASALSWLDMRSVFRNHSKYEWQMYDNYKNGN